MLEELFEELVGQQEEKVYRFAQKIIPSITRDDLLQPNDFPELENHPLFRYEEGILEGLRTAQMAYLSLVKNREVSYSVESCETFLELQ